MDSTIRQQSDTPNVDVTGGPSTPHVSKAALESMAHRIDSLPMLPQVLVRILQLSPDQNDYFEKISGLATEDPPFAVRLLAVANSASYMPVTPVKSIPEALTRVGASTITSLVASLAVQRVFVPSTQSQVDLWRHSIGVAVGAEAIARLAPELKINRNQAYLAGLLHDIGRFVMFEHAPEHLQKVDESNWSSPEELIDADVEVFKYTHSELGYLACIHWGLPEDLATVVRRHHENLDDSIRPGSLEANVLCVELADRLSLLIEEFDENDLPPQRELTEQIEIKCFNPLPVGKFVRSDVLATNIEKIQNKSHALLNSLGLS